MFPQLMTNASRQVRCSRTKQQVLVTWIQKAMSRLHKARLNLSKPARVRTATACQFASNLSLCCLLKNTFSLHGVCLHHPWDVWVYSWMITFNGCHFPYCTNNPFQFWRLIQVSVYKHCLLWFLLIHFSLQIASRTAGKLRYTQVTRNITTCGACGLLRENGELHVLY